MPWVDQPFSRSTPRGVNVNHRDPERLPTVHQFFLEQQFQITEVGAVMSFGVTAQFTQPYLPSWPVVRRW